MHIDDIDTPAVLIDLDRAEANLKRAQDYADSHGFVLRPHIKTHKLPLFAHMATQLGAKGINCQKLGEAEVMADSGLGDILITYNILGASKLDRLAALHRRVKMAVVADNTTVVDGYAGRFADAAHPLDVMVECDTGSGRCGVQDGAEALKVAQRIDAAPGLRFAGLMTYPPADPAATGRVLREMKMSIEAGGLVVPKVSSGGTPALYRAHETGGIDEYRPGTYIYSDRMMVAAGMGTLDQCAMHVLMTVVSRPTPDRAILDGGSKALAADVCPAPGHGHVVEYPGAVIGKLNEEHATVDLSECRARPEVGDRVRVIPNHTCVVTNLFDAVHLMRGDRVERVAPVLARGKSG